MSVSSPDVSCVHLLSQTSCTYPGGLWGKVFLADVLYDASSQSISEDIGHSSESVPRREKAVRLQLVATARVAVVSYGFGR